MQNTNSTLSVARLKEVLDYAPETGVFCWKVQKNNNGVSIGTVAGWSSLKGYTRIAIDGNEYAAHALAWYYVHGEWVAALDHKNTIPDDNRISNLRKSNGSLNLANCNIRIDNNSGFKGISWDKDRRKWFCKIKAFHKQKALGRYDSLAEAVVVYHNAAIENFGEFARTHFTEQGIWHKIAIGDKDELTSRGVTWPEEKDKPQPRALSLDDLFSKAA